MRQSGWAKPKYAKKWHYFTPSRSMCGKYRTPIHLEEFPEDYYKICHSCFLELALDCRTDIIGTGGLEVHSSLSSEKK